MKTHKILLNKKKIQANLNKHTRHFLLGFHGEITQRKHENFTKFGLVFIGKYKGLHQFLHQTYKLVWWKFDNF